MCGLLALGVMVHSILCSSKPLEMPNTDRPSSERKPTLILFSNVQHAMCLCRGVCCLARLGSSLSSHWFVVCHSFFDKYYSTPCGHMTNEGGHMTYTRVP